MPDENANQCKEAAIDRLRLMVRRSCAWPDERNDFVLALRVLSLDPADPNVDHSLVDLYGALHLSARTNEMVYLSTEHRRLMAYCVVLLSKP
jgi:hypothetical protein